MSTDSNHSPLSTSSADEDHVSGLFDEYERGSPASIEDVARPVIEATFASEGELLTASECNFSNSRDAVRLVRHNGITWAIKLVDRGTYFYPQDARKFIAFLAAIRQYKGDPSIRGAVFCKKTRMHKESHTEPFSFRLQEGLLEGGIVPLKFEEED